MSEPVPSGNGGKCVAAGRQSAAALLATPAGWAATRGTRARALARTLTHNTQNGARTRKMEGVAGKRRGEPGGEASGETDAHLCRRRLARSSPERFDALREPMVDAVTPSNLPSTAVPPVSGT